MQHLSRKQCVHAPNADQAVETGIHLLAVADKLIEEIDELAIIALGCALFCWCTVPQLLYANADHCLQTLHQSLLMASWHCVAPTALTAARMM